MVELDQQAPDFTMLSDEAKPVTLSKELGQGPVILSFYVFDSKSAPAFLRTIVDALPLKPLIDGLWAAIVTGSGLGGKLDALAVIALWGALGCYYAIRGFSWEQARA